MGTHDDEHLLVLNAAVAVIADRLRFFDIVTTPGATEDDVIALLKRTYGFDDLQTAFVLAMQAQNFSEVKAQMLALELSEITGRTGP